MKRREPRRSGLVGSTRSHRALIALTVTAIAAGALTVTAAIGALKTAHESTPLNYPDRKSVTAKCTGKEMRVGFGGYKFKTNPTGNTPGPYSFADGAGPAGGGINGWKFTAHNESAIYDDKLDSYAYCFKGSKPKVVKATKSIGEGRKSVAATCPKGKTLIGGGWSTDADPSDSGQVIMTGLERSNGAPREWDVSVYNEKTVPVKLTAIAVCGKGATPKAVEANVNVKELTEKSAKATCKGKDEVVFGGYSAEVDAGAGLASFVTRFYLSGDDEITVSGYDPGTAPSYDDTTQMKAIAYCR